MFHFSECSLVVSSLGSETCSKYLMVILKIFTLLGTDIGVMWGRLNQRGEFPELDGFLAKAGFFSQLTTLFSRLYFGFIGWRCSHR